MYARTVSLLGIGLLTHACAAALPGYTPPSPKLDRIIALQPKGGGFNEDGSYYLTDQEQKLDCKQLTGSIKVKILQIREAGGRVAPTAAASVAQQAARPIKGGTTYAVDLQDDAVKDRARLVRLNQELAAKGCKSYNLETELKPGNTLPPSPSVEAKKL